MINTGKMCQLKCQLVLIVTVGLIIFVCFISFQRTAAFWYNLHRNGEGDMLTRHAACPVLAGSKWGKYRLSYFLPSKTCRFYLLSSFFDNILFSKSKLEMASHKRLFKGYQIQNSLVWVTPHIVGCKKKREMKQEITQKMTVYQRSSYVQ